MNFLILLSIAFSVQSAFATGFDSPILTKVISAGVSTVQNRDSKTVEVFGTGNVRTTVVKGVKSISTFKIPLSREIMKAVHACHVIVTKKTVKDIKRPNCASGSTVDYYVGNKVVSVRSCGEVHTTNVSCVDSMIKLMDRF